MVGGFERNPDPRLQGDELVKALPEVGGALDDMPTFLGGLRSPFIFANFGWPGARLTLCKSGLRIGPSALLFNPLVPRRAFLYADLAEVQAVGTGFLARGIRFTSATSSQWVVFWIPSIAARSRLLGHLEGLVSNVRSEPARLDFFRPGPSRPV